MSVEAEQISTISTISKISNQQFQLFLRCVLLIDWSSGHYDWLMVNCATIMFNLWLFQSFLHVFLILWRVIANQISVSIDGILYLVNVVVSIASIRLVKLLITQQFNLLIRWFEFILAIISSCFKWYLLVMIEIWIKSIAILWFFLWRIIAALLVHYVWKLVHHKKYDVKDSKPISNCVWLWHKARVLACRVRLGLIGFDLLVFWFILARKNCFFSLKWWLRFVLICVLLPMIWK